MKAKEDIIIVGAGGLGKEVSFLLSQLNEYNHIGFVDDIINREINGKKILGTIEWLAKQSNRVSVAIAVADSKQRKQIYERLNKNTCLLFPNLISSKALIGEDVNFGRGNIVMPYCTFTANIYIEDFNIINLQTNIGHDSILSSYNTIFPDVSISGNSVIEEGVQIGVGSKLIQNIKLGKYCFVGAGSVVIRDVPEYTKVVGCPTRIINKDWRDNCE